MEQMIIKAAINILKEASTKNGILASAEGTENYNRIWARDSAIAGIAGLIVQDEKIITSFKNSLLNLAENQHQNGQIPSNISYNKDNELIKVSYGGLAGRVDATTWWAVAVCLYYFYTKDDNFKEKIAQNIIKAFHILDSWEFNGRGLMYVPLSGNWADEYVTQGYNLYDQLLRMWALSLASKLWQREDWHNKSLEIKELIETNYWLNSTKTNEKYHENAFKKAQAIPYWVCSFAPNNYDTRFDLAANALAILLIDKKDALFSIKNYLSQLSLRQKHWLFPAFLPIITQNDFDWQLLSQNYAYRFKNIPHHFHNGGIWTVFLGLMGMALVVNGEMTITINIYQSLIENIKKQENPYSFYEYFASDTLKASGMSKLCFSAAGTIFLHFAITEKEKIKNILFPV